MVKKNPSQIINKSGTKEIFPHLFERYQMGLFNEISCILYPYIPQVLRLRSGFGRHPTHTSQPLPWLIIPGLLNNPLTSE